jgi:hypothetical protein
MWLEPDIRRLVGAILRPPIIMSISRDEMARLLTKSRALARDEPETEAKKDAKICR